METNSHSPRQAALIVNVRSRRGREWYPRVVQSLKDKGFELTQSVALKDSRALDGHIAKAVQQGTPLVIIGGGDGTFSSSVRHFIGQDRSILGVLPLGTGNAFARDLGIQADVEIACKVLADGRPLAVDLGKAGDRPFVNVATLGLTTLIAHQLKGEAKRAWGRFVYAGAIFKALSRLKPFRAVLTTDDGEKTFETLQIVIGSGRFHAGPFPVTPTADITDHRLNGYFLATTNRRVLFKYALKLWGGHHVDLPEVTAFSTKQARLETLPLREITIDGEPGGRTPVQFSVIPQALRVMVPADFDPHAR